MDRRSRIEDAFDDAAAAGNLHPRPDIVQTQPAASLQDSFGVEPLPVIPDGHVDMVGLIMEMNGDPRRFRMPDAILDAFLDRAEENELLSRLDHPGRPLDSHLGPDKARLIDPVYLLRQGLLKAQGLDPITAQAPRQVPQISHRLPDIIPDINQGPSVHLATLIYDVDLNRGQAQDLPHIVMDFPADGHESLLLDLHLGFQRL